MTEPTEVRRSDERGVATLTLDSPGNRNALSSALVGRLSQLLAECAGDDGVRAVVLAHTGTTFCAGADLRNPPTPQELVGLLRQILELPKPVLARIDGHVRAGGLGLLGACDIVASTFASDFAFTEVRIGVAPAVISLTLVPRVHPRALTRYYLTGERFDAEDAAAIGLVTETHYDLDEILAPVLDGIRRASPQALAETKALVTAKVLENFDRDAEALSALSARLFSSDEAREGMTAFLERRDPAWAM
ncbi:enoyl-CoA hydratase family protein [Streptomyces sp. NPDC002640]